HPRPRGGGLPVRSRDRDDRAARHRARDRGGPAPAPPDHRDAVLRRVRPDRPPPAWTARGRPARVATLTSAEDLQQAAVEARLARRQRRRRERVLLSGGRVAVFVLALGLWTLGARATSPLILPD